MLAEMTSTSQLLDTAYTVLGLHEGELLNANFSPAEGIELEQWLNKGDWLALAKQVGAEKIFFVKDDPVIVFARSDSNDAASLRKLFNDIWCMARPQRLFLASSGELAVYDLTKPPVGSDQDWERNKPLAVVKRISEVARELKSYQRENIESGKLFEEKHFGADDQRADQALIRDLKLVRKELTSPDLGKELDRKHAHALIGRSIFIRYLEDRGILTRDYFENIASTRKNWKVLLDAPIGKDDVNPEMGKRLYPRVLGNKEFTYALFDQLSEDFNGDMFPSDLDEKKAVDVKHLKLLQSFLRGDIGEQKNFFFWAYKFDIIPIELTSSIYEEFYLTTNADSGNHGTHYTPSSLVRFVLSQVLTSDCLEKNPRILDPCCGSGIFLVEAFRRIVRYRFYKQGKMPNSRELEKIIKDQLAGIEINEEAIRVTAFSLYLALLHFQKPPAISEQIKKGQRLPGLKYQAEAAEGGKRFNNLIEANAFDVASKVKDRNVLKQFSENCADVIVGNPPWGQPKKGDKIGTEALEKTITWCAEHRYPVGDKERSQAFIWRTLNFLRDGGTASLLVSTGIFFKHHSNSRNFRIQWLNSIRLIEVINFSHVRDIFFSGAISPFASIVFQKISEPVNKDQVVNYFSAKKSAQAVQLKSVILSYADLQRIRQVDLLANDKLWKIYWWGNHRDAALINALEINSALRDFCDLENTGRGFLLGNKEKSSGWLQKYLEMPTASIPRYGSLNLNKLKKVPAKVERQSKSEGLYFGKRILVKRGISQKTLPKGQIFARLESEEFCFRHSIYCLKLSNNEDWRYKIVLGVLWSSLARYYFFLTTSTWGTWHHEIHYEELLELPIRFPQTQGEIDNLVDIIDKLCEVTPLSKAGSSAKKTSNPDGIMQLELGIHSLSLDTSAEELASLERRLDEAVFDLYELRISERDLVRDMCDFGIEFFYNKNSSEAVRPILSGGFKCRNGLLNTISKIPDPDLPNELKEYLITFLSSWNRELFPDGEFSWEIIMSDESIAMLGLVFSTQQMRDASPFTDGDESQWSEILNQLSSDLLVPYGSSSIFMDGIVRAVTDTDIIIIKRNEKRLWTKSMAREDVEATLCQAINLQESRN
jgi:N-6 DNA Methylase